MKKPKQPDQFERIADDIRLESQGCPYAMQISDNAWTSIRYRIEDRLRREHRAVLRVVRSAAKNPIFASNVKNAILKALKARVR